MGVISVKNVYDIDVFGLSTSGGIPSAFINMSTRQWTVEHDCKGKLTVIFDIVRVNIVCTNCRHIASKANDGAEKGQRVKLSDELLVGTKRRT